MLQEQYFDHNGFEKQIVPIPNMIRAALILLVLNVLIALWFYFSPNIVYSQTPKPTPQSYAPAVAKASPFQPVSVDKPRKGVRRPPKAEPYFTEAVVVPSGSEN